MTDSSSNVDKDRLTRSRALDCDFLEVDTVQPLMVSKTLLGHPEIELFCMVRMLGKPVKDALLDTVPIAESGVLELGRDLIFHSLQPCRKRKPCNTEVVSTVALKLVHEKG